MKRVVVSWTIVLSMMIGLLGNVAVGMAAPLTQQNEAGRWCTQTDENGGSVSGRVLDTAGEPAADITVVAYAQANTRSQCRTKTDDTGSFVLSNLSPQTYEVKVRVNHRREDAIAPELDPVEVTAGATVALGDIQLEPVPETVSILGTVVDESGASVTDIEARAYLRQVTDGDATASADSAEDRRRPSRSQHGNGAEVVDGAFQIDAWAGEYEVALRIMKGSRYFIPADQEVLVDTTDGLSETVTIPVGRYSVTVAGTLLTPDGQAATGIKGSVRASSADPDTKGNVARVDRDTGQYELYLAPGTWALSYAVQSDDYLPHSSEPVTLTVSADEVVNQDFTLTALDATIQGTVTDADGNPVRRGHVVAQEPGDDAQIRLAARVRDGAYSLPVASGRDYEVTAHLHRNAEGIQPAAVTVSPTANSTTTVDLQFLAPDATISGLVTLESGEVVDDATVRAYSNSGQRVRTKSNDDGTYQLDVVTGVWTVEARWYSRSDSLLYRTTSTVEIDLTTASTETVNLVLTPESETVPVAAQGEFSGADGWSGELTDGTRVDIPAGAFANATDMSITVTPVVEELPGTSNAQPLNYGYEINVYDSATGQPMNSGFASDVQLTLTYSNGELGRSNAGEGSLTPAYYDEESEQWVMIEEFTVDNGNNAIQVEVDHFSLWALVYDPTGSTTVTTPNLDYSIHLPFVTR